MFRLLLASLALLAYMPAVVSAETVEMTRHRDWQVVEDRAGRCLAVTTVGLRAADSGLITVALLPGDGTAAATMSARVPLGAALDAPLAYSYRTGATATGLAWQSCDETTCLAVAALDGAEISRLERAREVFFAFRPLPGVTPLIVPVSLMGLTRAWADVQACR